MFAKGDWDDNAEDYYEELEENEEMDEEELYQALKEMKIPAEIPQDQKMLFTKLFGIPEE